MESNFTGFVLIGGKSSRMGADKFALKFDGETFLEHAVETLSSICENVKIVLNRTQTIETNQPIIRDVYENRGSLGGIHAALKNCETKFAVILAVDLPFVTTEAIKNLANFALASNKYLAFVPRQTDGKPQPLCGIYRAGYCLPTLEKLMSENNSASVRDLLELIYPRYVDQSKLSDETDRDIFFNVNHPSDFQLL